MKKIKIIIFIAALFTFFGCSNMIVELTNNEQQNTINQPENTQQQNTNNQSENTEQTPANNQTENNNQNENNEQSGTTNQSENNEQQSNNNQSGDNEQQGTNNQSNNNEQSGTNTQNETNNQSETNTPTENNGQQNTNNQSETNQQSGTNTQNENNEQQNTNNQSQNNEQTNPQPKQYIVYYQTERGEMPPPFLAAEDYILTAEDLPVLYVPGYDFDGWYVDNTKVLPDTYTITKGLNLKAKWIKGNPTYTVKHYCIALDGSNVLTDEEVLSGSAGEQTQAQAKDYYGFYAQTITQQTILENNSTEVAVYYSRKYFTFTFDLDGGTGSQTISGPYESKVNCADPVKPNSIFIGWDSQDGSLPQTFTQDASYKALWTNEGSNFGLYIEHDFNSTIEISTNTQNSDLYITAESGFSSYNWKIDTVAPDGVTEIVSENEPNVLVLQNYSSKTRGVYSISLTAIKNGIEYSGRIFVRIY